MAASRKPQDPTKAARQEALDELRIKVEEAELRLRLAKAREELSARKTTQ